MRMDTNKGEGMMKTYTVRKASRASVQCQFCYLGDGILAHGTIWDLSETGWRATGTHPVAVGTEFTVTITIKDGKQSRNILIDEAIVRWSEGRHTGWEITKMDPAAREDLQEYLMDFIEEFKVTPSAHETMEEVR